MSSTTSFQSLIPNVFRPVYTWNSNTNSFTTLVTLSNIDRFTANVATFGTINIGDLSNNVYLGSNAGNLNSFAASCNATGNTSIGISSAATLSNSANSEFIGFKCGIQGSNISNSFIAGAFAGYKGKNINNSVLIGHSNSVGALDNAGLPAGLSTISNTISIGGFAGGSGSSNIYIGTSSGSNMTGSGNLFIGNGLYNGNIPSYMVSDGTSRTISSTVSNKLLIGSIIAGDLSTGVVSIGSTNTNATTCNTYNPDAIVNGISLDVANYTRVQKGLSIGCDPGYFTLDVNGQFRSTDGAGWLSLSNMWPATGGTSNNSVVEMKSISSGGTMSLSLGGDLTATSAVFSGAISATSCTFTGPVSSPGYFTIQGSGISLSFGTTGAAGTFSNVGTITKTGLIVGTVYDSNSKDYYTARTIVFATTGGGAYSTNLSVVSSGTLTYALTNGSLNIVLSNTAVSGTTYPNVYYNFTMFPTS